MIGKTISHYKIIEKIGEGGMGIVYKAQDTKLDRIVALKFLPSQLSLKAEEKKRFVHEAKAAASLDHPHICSIHEIDETDDGQMFIVMAHYEGENLKDKIASGPLPIHEAINIAIQIAEGLHDAHEKHIIHRDIKSANIIITDKGQAKILDFGLAKLKGKTKLTREGTTLGTIDYMSPEQASADKVDHRSDIWSLGVMLYEMVTGRLPFPGKYDQAIMYAILNEEPEPVTGLRTGVPMELEKIINKTLTKEPAERYQHADDLMVDLKKVKRDSQPGITPVKKKTRPEITLRASRKVAELSGLILLVIVIIAGYFVFKGKTETELPPIEPDEKPSLAVVYFENKSGDEKLDNWRDAFAELLTIDLSQSKYLRVLRSDEIYSIFKKLNLLEARRYSTNNLREIARNGRVNHILRGSYIKDEDNFVITTMLFNADTGETISSLSVRAKKGEIFSNIDDITRDVKTKLNLSNKQISSDIDRSIGQITTSSPEALEYYMQGMRHVAAGEWRKSIDSMENAIKIDPEFAMAYRRLSINYNTLGYREKSDQYTILAREHANHLPERERLIIQADFYTNSETTIDKAIEGYQKVIRLYPQDYTANMTLGVLYNNLEEFDQAIERFEVPIRNKNELVFPYCQLAMTFQKKGEYEKAEEILEYYLNHFQDHCYIRIVLAENFMCQNKLDLALIEIEKAISIAPESGTSYWRQSDIYFYKGDFSQAEKVQRKLMEAPETTSRNAALMVIGIYHITQGQLTEAENKLEQALIMAKESELKSREITLHNYIGYIHFISGKFEECLNEFDQAMVIARKMNEPVEQKWGRYFKAITYLKIKSPSLARKAEAELLEWVNNRKNKKLIRWHYLFQGEKELKKKNPSGAIEFFKKAISLLPYQSYHGTEPMALFLDALARAYLESGDLGKARNQFQKITALTEGRAITGDIYARAFYNLGKIHQQKSWKAKAIDNYHKFIELWKDCDPIFRPLVKDARRRVIELEGNK